MQAANVRTAAQYGKWCDGGTGVSGAGGLLQKGTDTVWAQGVRVCIAL